MKFRPGDHLVVQSGPIQHHGIYIGNNDVIDFSQPGWGQNRIRKRSYKDFCKKRQSDPWLFDYTNSENILRVKEAAIVHGYRLSKVEALPRQIICFRAESQIGEGKYRIEHSNCEHFAHWCAIGSHLSTQSSIMNEISLQLFGEVKSLEFWKNEAWRYEEIAQDYRLLIGSRESRFKAYLFQNIEKWDYESLKFVEKFFYREYCDLVPTSTIFRIKQEAGKWDHPELWQK